MENTCNDPMQQAAELFCEDEMDLETLEDSVEKILVAIGEDPNREGLLRTPHRVAKSYKELLAGYRMDPQALINNAVFDVAYDEMVIVRDIEFSSMCEHHMLPFIGRAHVAYIPSDKVIGLSKIPRIVDLFSKRLQVQERMTTQIAEFIDYVLKPQGVAVVVEGLHMWKLQLEELLAEMAEQAHPEPGGLFVVGCSTSEVAGQRIGTAGAMEIGEMLFQPLKEFAGRYKLHLAFQGCEHINRALTIESETAKLYNLEPVSVVPKMSAGGAMSAYAYEHLDNAVVVEEIRAQYGIDIGQTLIGMHLKQVAIPLRTSIGKIGEATVTVATTRPKLIGGARAKY